MSSPPAMPVEAVIAQPIRAQFEAFLDEHRAALDASLDGLTEEQARRSLVPSRTTLLGLVKHATFVEKVWFDEAITGRSRAEIGIPETPDESFVLDDRDTIATVTRAHREACESARRAAAALGLDDLVHGNRRGPLPLRWVYLHVLRELAQHCGHADILREQLLALPGVSQEPGHRRSGEEWDDAYRGAPPWDIGRPQPVFVRLAESGALAGRLLDVGCGTGQNALLAAEHGAEVTGIDISPLAVERARGRAAERGLAARFAVHDARRLDALGEQFDVVIDSGTFHTFDDADRATYVAALAAVTRPEGRYHLVCFSERTPGEWGPRRVTEDELRAAFAGGWTAESIERTTFDIAPGGPVPQAQAWAATFRRTPPADRP